MKFGLAVATLWLLESVLAQTVVPEDSFIWESKPNNSYGSRTSISVDQKDDGGQTRGLLKFNSLSIGASEILESASLRIHSIDQSSGTISAFRMKDAWSDSSSTWNNLNNGNPNRESSASFSLTSPSSGTVYERDVTVDVQAWLNNPNSNQGWILINSSSDGWDFSSAESSDPPELVLTTTTGVTETVVVDADFYSGRNGFVYKDDLFFGTNQPNYALGRRSNKQLEVVVGGIDDKDIADMSGGFKYDFSSAASTSSVQLVFDWTLVLDKEFESNEYAEMVVALDGVETIIQRITGNGAGGSDDIKSGTSQEVSWSNVASGSHSVSLGVYCNKKTKHDEYATVRLDNVKLSLFGSGSAPNPTDPPTPLPTPLPTNAPTPVKSPSTGTIVDANFGSGLHGFVYQDDTFQGTNSPAYATGQRVQGDIFSGSSGLEVRLGGIDDDNIMGMSGGWSYTFTVSEPSDVEVEFDNELFLASTYESYEYGQMIVSFDGDERVVATLRGDGAGGPDMSDMGIDVSQVWTGIATGTHTVILGAYNNKKTKNDEFTRLHLDHVTISAIPAPLSGSQPPDLSGTQCPNGPATYFPGDLKVTLNGGLATGSLLVSTGLAGRVLTRKGQRVQYDAGGKSSVNMHSRADGAATLPDDSNPNRYFLVSNSETNSGGVGILHFDTTTSPHSIIDYRLTGQNTNTGSRNCGGGRTPWGTWLTSEESGTGSVYEIDPNDSSTGKSNCRDGGNCCRTPIVPSSGGNYESNAFWEGPDNKYHFFTTEDAEKNYRLTRFIPDDNIPTMLAKPRKLDRLCGANGQRKYLKLVCKKGCGGDRPSGTYSWSNSRSPGSGDQSYPNAEGIDVKNDNLYFVTKGQRRLYIVDLSGNTWHSGETIQNNSGSEFSPDQLARITGSNSPDNILYFCEDGTGSQDINARGMDENGDYRFFKIIRGYKDTETTGLTFSPDNKYMYFAHQENSEIWQIWREDGCSFGDGNYLDVNYHSFDPFRMLRGNMIPETESGSAESEFEE